MSSNDFGTTAIVFATKPQLRGLGVFSMSRDVFCTNSRSGRKRRNAMSAGGTPDFTAHAVQSSIVGVSSTTDAKREITGSRIPVTPALSVRRLSEHATCSIVFLTSEIDLSSL